MLPRSYDLHNVSEHDDEKPRAHNPKGNPAWRKGGPSPNPGGRPRQGLAFADAARRRIDPDVLFDLLDRYLADEEVPIDKRLAAALPYVHAGYLKPPTATQLNVTGSLTTSERPYAELPLEELRARIAAARAAAALPADSTDSDE